MFSFNAFIVVLGASLSALSLGLDVGMISSTLIQPTFISFFDNPSSGATGGIVASFSAGATFGAYGCAFVADRFGRVWCLFTGAVVALVGVALQAGAMNLPMLILGRIINGFGAGQLTAVFGVYASEVAPPQIRGAFGGMQMLMIEGAIFIASATGYGFGINFENTIQWRGPLAVQGIPLVFLMPICYFLPESPRWLISKGKEDKAWGVLRRIHNAATDAFVEGEYHEIKEQIRAEQEMFQPTWMQIAKRPSWRKRIILVCTLQIFAQLTGINCIKYYAGTIYEYLGFNTHDALLLNLLYGAFGFISAIFWVSCLDRFPRVRILIVSTTFMCAALLVQSILSAVYTGDKAGNAHALRAQVAMFYVFQLFFVSVGMLAWLIPPEMCPMVIRAKANSISVSTNNVIGLVVAQVASIGLEDVGFKFFYLFVAADIVAVVIYYFYFPETSKLTLEEINIMFGDQVVDHDLQKDVMAGAPIAVHQDDAEAERGGKKE